MIKVGTLFFGLSLLLISCGSSETEDSTNVAQDRIYQSFQVDYKADTEEMVWTSSYTFGGPTGTTLELRGDSATAANDNTQEKTTDSLNGTFYRRTEKTKFFPGPHKFSFKDSENKGFKNSITMKSAEFPSKLDDSFSRKKGLVVVWEGLPLAGGEKIWLTIYNVEKGEVNSALETKVGSTGVFLRPATLENIPLGKVEIQMVRYLQKDLSEATSVGGYISYNYHSVTKTIKMTE